MYSDVFVKSSNPKAWSLERYIKLLIYLLRSFILISLLLFHIVIFFSQIVHGLAAVWNSSSFSVGSSTFFRLASLFLTGASFNNFKYMNILYLHIWKPLCYSFSISSYLAPKCFHISSAAISSPSSCSPQKTLKMLIAWAFSVLGDLSDSLKEIDFPLLTSCLNHSPIYHTIR